MTYRIFVYGTLKKGHRNNHYLSSSQYIKTAKTKTPSYIMKQYCYDPRMIDEGQYPGISMCPPQEKCGHVEGEVWEVDEKTLKRLDDLEDEGNEYTRTSVTLDDNTTAQVYLYNTSPNRPELPAKNISYKNGTYIWTK